MSSNQLKKGALAPDLCIEASIGYDDYLFTFFEFPCFYFNAGLVSLRRWTIACINLR